jgi:hypothetical protein
MGIRDDFSKFWDGNGLCTPSPCVPTPNVGGSDNGPLFTSIYYILLKRNGQLTNLDKQDYSQKIEQCVDSQGLLNRVPLNENDGLESVDDYLGTLNGCIELGNTKIPRTFLWACIKNKGSMDNQQPGKWQWQDFLIRQPQLLCSMISASFPSLVNPLHWLIRLAFFPLYFLSAMIVATSCMGDSPTDSNDRLLSWQTQNCLKKVSLLCYLGSLVWMWRLKKVFGLDMMKAVCGIYFQPNGLNQNPYSKYWID